MELFNELLYAIDTIKAGNVVGIGAVLTIAVRIYRMIPRAPWPTEKHNWVVMLVLAIIGFFASAATGVFAFGMSWPAGIAAGLDVAVNAMGFDQASKAVGAAVRKAEPRLVKEHRSAFGKIASVLMPPPKG